MHPRRQLEHFTLAIRSTTDMIVSQTRGLRGAALKRERAQAMVKRDGTFAVPNRPNTKVATDAAVDHRVRRNPPKTLSRNQTTSIVRLYQSLRRGK